MKRLLVICGVIFSFMQLQGCVGLFAAGAAGTAILATDPRTADQQLADQRIEMEASDIIGEEPFNTDDAHFNVVSFYAKVLVVGQSLDANLPAKLVERIKKIQGVKKVYNQVRHDAPVGMRQISADTLLTTRVKSALLAAEDTPSNSVKVITENAEVFLLGTLTREEAKRVTDTVRNVSGIDQVIAAFDYSN